LKNGPGNGLIYCKLVT